MHCCPLDIFPEIPFFLCFFSNFPYCVSGKEKVLLEYSLIQLDFRCSRLESAFSWRLVWLLCIPGWTARLPQWRRAGFLRLSFNKILITECVNKLEVYLRHRFIPLISQPLGWMRSDVRRLQRVNENGPPDSGQNMSFLLSQGLQPCSECFWIVPPTMKPHIFFDLPPHESSPVFFIFSIWNLCFLCSFVTLDSLQRL